MHVKRSAFTANEFGCTLNNQIFMSTCLDDDEGEMKVVKR